MIEFLERLIGKECIIRVHTGTSDSTTYMGTIKEVASKAICIEHEGCLGVINLDYVLGIMEMSEETKMLWKRHSRDVNMR